MFPQPNIVITFQLDTSQANQKLIDFRNQVYTVKQDIIALQNASGQSLAKVGESLKRQWIDQAMRNSALFDPNTQGFTDAGKEAFNMYQKALTVGMADIRTETAATSKAFVQLGQALSTALGFGAMQVINNVLTAFKGLLQNANDYANALFKLGASVRMLQKGGMDISMKGTLENVLKLKKEFGNIFSMKDMIEGTAQVQLLTRNFGFTQEQIDRTVKMSAALALINGKEFNESAKQLALFYSSGYGEALQRAGVSVNRLTVVEEARRMGLDKSYMALTEMERAQAAESLVTRLGTTAIVEAMNMTDTYIGKLRALQSQYKDMQDQMSLGLAPINLAWEKVKIIFFKGVSGLINDILKITSVAAAGIISVIATATMAFENFKSMASGKGFAFNAKDAIQVYKNIFEEMKNAFNENKLQPINLDQLQGFTGKDAAGTAAEKQKALDDSIAETEKSMEDLYSELLDAQDQFKEDSIKAEEEYAKDLLQADEDYVQKKEDLWIDHYRNLQKIGLDYQRDLANYETDYQRDLADLSQSTQQDIQEETQKYQEDVEKAERDHLERLKKLREEFLFDMEDALRERDAKAVLQLIRRYSLDVTQENRKYANDQKDAADQHQQEIEDIRKQEAEKRAELWEKYQEQLADAKLAMEQKRADEQAAYAIKLEDAAKAYADEKKQLLEQYNEKLDDLKKSLEDQISEIVKSWVKQNDVTQKYGRQVLDVLSSMFGEGGESDLIFGYLTSQMDKYTTELEDMNKRLEDAMVEAKNAGNDMGINGLNSTSGGTSTGTATGHQAGGAVLATTPRFAKFGEIPELATFTPLNRLGDLSSQLSPFLGGNSYGNGKVKIEVLLSPDLQARITDATLGQVADVLLGAM